MIQRQRSKVKDNSNKLNTTAQEASKRRTIKNIKKIASTIDVPLVVCGGARTIEDIREASEAGADAIAAGSMFVYLGKLKGVMMVRTG